MPLMILLQVKRSFSGTPGEEYQIPGKLRKGPNRYRERSLTLVIQCLALETTSCATFGADVSG